MALFKIFKGSSTALGATSATQAANEGFAYFTPDDGKFYIDIADAATAVVGVNRIPLNAHWADYANTATQAVHATSAEHAYTAIKADSAAYAATAGQAIHAASANYAQASLTASYAVTALRALSAGSAGYAASAAQATHSASANYAQASLTASYSVTALRAISAGSAGYAASAANSTYAASAGYTQSALTAAYAVTALRAISAGSAGYAASAAQATHSASANWANLSGTANQATKVTQNASSTANTSYRVLLSTSGVDTTEVGSLNKSSNLQYNPSTNKLSTGNLQLTGTLNVSGQTTLSDNLDAQGITATDLLVNGAANFVQSPTAPTPANGDNSTKLATTAFVKGGFKPIQTAVDSGAATTNKWVSRIQQNANGVVTATMASLDTSGTWSGKAAKLTDLTTADKGSSSDTWRYAWFSYNDNTTGRPAYDSSYAYQTSTQTLRAKHFLAQHTSGGGFEFTVTYGSTVDMSMMIGTGNVNHGLYDHIAGKWMIYADGSGNVTVNGNAASATKLATARTINGTSFDGSANITTTNWGTARNISISDSNGTNTGAAVSVNGSAAVTLKLPSSLNLPGTLDVTGNTSLHNETTIDSATIGNMVVTGGTSFSQIPTAPTAAAGDNSTKLATTEFVKTSVAGLSGAMHFRGTTTTTISDGSTTNPITIGGSSYTASAGDVVLREVSAGNIFEYVWTGSQWEMLGRDTSFKVTQTAVDSGTAATNKWASRIQQDANGNVTVTMASLDTSGTWSGKAGSAGYAASASNSTYAASAGYTQTALTANYAVTALRAISAGSAGYSASAAQATHSASANYSQAALTSSYAVTALRAISAGSAGYAASAAQATHAASANYSSSAANATYSASSNYAQWAWLLANKGGSTVSATSELWAHDKTGAGNAATTAVWFQRWRQSGLTYTASGATAATALTDSGDMVIWLSKSNTTNALYANLAVDGQIYAASGFVGDLTGKAGSAGYAASAAQATHAASANYAQASLTASYTVTALRAISAGSASYAASAAQATHAASANYSQASLTASYAVTALRAISAGSAGYAAQATYAASTNYAQAALTASYAVTALRAISAGSAGYAASAANSTYAASAGYTQAALTAAYAVTALRALSAGSAGYAASAAQATHSASANWANLAGTAVQATKITQNASTTANASYRILLSTSGVDTAEVGAINKNANLQYNPSTNKLSTGNLQLTGTLTVTGQTTLSDNLSVQGVTATDLLVNGAANFVQPPTAPTPADGDSSTKLATTAFIKWGNIAGKPSSYTPSSHTHYELATIGNQRTTATTPNTYVNRLIFQGLKTNSSFGSPSTDTYSYVIGLRGWSDSSGGNSHELAFNNTGIFWRSGATTSWGNWYRIYTTGNKPTKSDVGLGNVTNDAQIPKSIGTAKGDIIYWNASSDPKRLAVGSDNQVLIVASGIPSWSSSLNLAGTLDVTGNTNLHNETAIDSATIGNMVVTGGTSFTQIPTAPTATAGDNSTKLATTEFVYNAFTVNDAMVFKGVVNADSDLPATHKQGWTYKVGTAGTYAGQVCEIGDTIYCITDGTAADNAHWVVVQNNIDILPVARGGTGATSAADARTNLLGTGTTGQFWRGDNSWSSTLTGNLTLYSASGDSPGLIFNRNGGSTDWKIFVTSGKLSFQSATDASTWTERAYFKDNSGDFVAGSFTGNNLTASQAVSTDANKKLVSTNLSVSDPSASGTGITYIATISQSALGKITATKSTVRSATTGQTGVVQLTDSTSSTSTTTAATPNSVKTAYDLANNHKYWANIEATSGQTYNKEPEVKSVKIGNGTASATATKSVQMIFDENLQVLNFVFS